MVGVGAGALVHLLLLIARPSNTLRPAPAGPDSANSIFILRERGRLADLIRSKTNPSSGLLEISCSHSLTSPLPHQVISVIQAHSIDDASGDLPSAGPPGDVDVRCRFRADGGSAASVSVHPAPIKSAARMREKVRASAPS